jgi:DNA adenine methylase
MAAIRGKAFLGDTNPDLVGCFKAVQNEPQELLALLREHAIKFESEGKTHYDAVREQHNLDGTEGAARFIFLNRACFNGLWRVNSKGHFNVPMGRYENPLAPAFSRIAPAAEALTGTSISLARFDSLVADAREGSFIYFDPPYDPLTKTASFTAYTADGFGDKEQEELRDLAIALAKRGCYVMLSNSSTPLTRELYGDTTHFHMHEVPVRRVISAVGSTRTVVNEIVVTTYAPPIS